MIRILSEDVIDASHWTYKRVAYETDVGGRMRRASREIFDRGDASAVLLYDRSRRMIVLTRQFRLPAYLNGRRETLLEVCAGGVDSGDPLEAALRETREETGYALEGARKVFECYMSPGSVTEKLHFFVAEYRASDRRDAGGGLADEGEHIEVVEVVFDEAVAMMARGEIEDAKTMLLLQYALLHRLME